MSSLKINFKIESDLETEYRWVIQIFGNFIGFKPDFVGGDSNNQDETILIAEHGLGDIQVSHFFRNSFIHGDYFFKSYFQKEPLHYTSSGKPDYLSTCFYLLSYLQEYANIESDQHDRFPYETSLQKYFNCVRKNLVAEYFDKLFDQTPKLKNSIQRREIPTEFFLTHDIDMLYGALSDNGKYYLRKGRIGKLLQLIFNHYIRTSDFMLLDRIMKIEDEHDVKSTFFWIVNKGKGISGIENADYDINDPKVLKLKQNISQNGFFNGLHKSDSADSYEKELKKLNENDLAINRNHYLKIQLPNSFSDIEKAGIQLDTTMGFAEDFGLRNNFGLPIHPYNLKQKRAYNFIEVPLTIMDATLKHYLHKNSEEAEKEVINFLEANKTNALFTILWHNNYFFDAADKGWLKLYKSILTYIKENNFEAVTPDKLISYYQVHESLLSG